MSLCRSRAFPAARCGAGRGSPRASAFPRWVPRRWAPSWAWPWPSCSWPRSGRRCSPARPSAGSPGGWWARWRTGCPALPDSPPMLAADLTRALAILGVAWLVAVLCAPRVPSPIVWTAVVAAHVDAADGAAAGADRRLQLPALRAHAGDLRRQSLRRPAAHRPPGPRLPLLQLAPPPLALRAALHPAHGGPRAALAARPRTGHGRACCWRRRWAPSCWSRSPRAGSGARRRPRSRSSGSTRSCSSTASAAPTTSRWCCCAAWRRSRWRSPAGRRGPRRGGTSGPAPAPCWPRASSRRPPSSRPSWSWLAAGACLPWVAQAAPACCHCSSSRCSTAGACRRPASRTGSSGR